MGKISNPLLDRLSELEDQKNFAYKERNYLVSLVAKMAIALGGKAGLGKHDPNDNDWDVDWRTIVFIDIPSVGQCSWHVHDSEVGLFNFLDEYDEKWDGHSTEDKYNRIAQAHFESKRFIKKLL